MGEKSNPSFHRKIVSARPKEARKAKGFAPAADMTVRKFLESSASLGFQATELARAISILESARREKARMFLSMTSNIISCGLREVVAALCARKAIDAIVTTTGSIEEDLMKTKFDFLLGDFDADDKEVKRQGLNRIGNVFVPDEAYLWMEDFDNDVLFPACGERLVPSEYCRIAGGKVKDEGSFLFQCARRKIPVFVPGFVDGAIGDHVFFYNQPKARLVVDQAPDLKKFYDLILSAEKTAGLVIGGGIAKHHLIGAAILRNGLDYAVYVSTGTAGDGSLSGARPTEAVSWNKLKDKKNSAFVEAEATLVLPLIAAKLLS